MFGARRFVNIASEVVNKWHDGYIGYEIVANHFASTIHGSNLWPALHILADDGSGSRAVSLVKCRRGRLDGYININGAGAT